MDEAKRLQGEKVVELQEKEARKLELEVVKEQKEKEKEVAETPEKEALEFYKKVEEEEQKRKDEQEQESRDQEAASYFQALDLDSDGMVTLEELKSRPGLDTNKDSQVSDEEAKIFLSDQELFTLEIFMTVGFVLLKPHLDLDQDSEISTDIVSVIKEDRDLVKVRKWWPTV